MEKFTQRLNLTVIPYAILDYGEDTKIIGSDFDTTFEIAANAKRVVDGRLGGSDFQWLSFGAEPKCAFNGGGGNQTTPDVFNQRINLDKLSPCASSVMHSLMYQSQGSVVAMIQKFSGEVPGYSWNLETGYLGTNTNAITKKVLGGASTTVDVSKYSRGSDLALARTLLHEAVHAYLVSYFANNPTLANLSYPDMMVEWQKTRKPDLNAVHHIEMTIEFKNDIAVGLREYGDLHGVTFSTNTEKDQFYSDMAWGGLEATPAYQQLNTADKNRIQDTLNAEQCGNDRNGNPKASKGNPSGC